MIQRYPYLDNDLDFTRPDSPGSGGYINYIGGGYHTPESITSAPQFAGISIFPTVSFGSGTITVGSNGEYCLYSDPTGYSTVIPYGAPGVTLTLTDLAVNYIYVDYNSGAPVILATTDRTILSSVWITTRTPIVTAYRNGTTVVGLSWGPTALAQPTKILDRLIATERFAYESGLVLSDGGSQTIEISAGRVWYGTNDESTALVNSATAPTYLHYKVAGVWTQASITQYNNSQYQGAAGLVTLTNNRYAVNWIWKGLGTCAGNISVVLGVGDYKLYDALASKPPSPPDCVRATHILVGRIIVEKGQVVATQVDSAFDQTFTSSSQLLNTFDENIIFAGQSGEGIQVDFAAPTFPWADQIGTINARGVGATDPAYAVFRGGIRQYQFSVNDEVWCEFHLPHDYVPGSDIYIHAHWAYNAAAVTTGGPTWGFESTAAKGHQQQAFVAPVRPTIYQAAITSALGGRYMHHIAEIQLSAASPSATQLNNNLMEPDTLILVRCYLAANTMDGGALPFLSFCDLHYQSTGIGTKNKAPNFYVP